MKNKARFWKIIILSAVVLSFASLVAYKVIAGTLGGSSCPPTDTCPSMTNCPSGAEATKECSVKDGADKEACKMTSGEKSKEACPYKGQTEKKAGWVHPKKQCDL